MLATVDLTGRRTPLPDTGGNFRAPQWGGDGQLVYAVEARTTQQLVVQESVGEPPRAVLNFEGFIEFRLSPSGDRIAYQVTFLAGGDGGPSQQFQLAASQSPPTALPGVLTVLDLDTGTVTEVSRGATRGFFWRPDGEALLFIEDEGPRLRWQVWDGAESGRFSAFAPTVTYAQAYLPFFDQFAQAVSPWSPDGTRFVYTAVDGTGEAGVWVQEISGEPPRRVASGEVGFWSPR
jgi:Tol biopolymer transport system component